MATDADLLASGFAVCSVTARKLNIVHDDQHKLGPFCRLAVTGELSDGPGAYAWAVDGTVMHVGKAGRLRAVVQGTKVGRAYNDYTYVPASKVKQTYTPRVRVNALLNEVIGNGSAVSWWWLETPSERDAASLETRLLSEWTPAWNRAGVH